MNANEHVNVLRILDDILLSDVPDKEKHFSDIYRSFKKTYPHLFALVCKIKNKECDEMRTLQYMLDMMDKIKRKETTQETATAEVGQTIFKKFVDVDKLTPAEGGKGGISVVTSPCKESDT